MNNSSHTLIRTAIEVITTLFGVPMYPAHAEDPESYWTDDGNNIFIHLHIGNLQAGSADYEWNVRIRHGYEKMDFIKEKAELVEAAMKSLFEPRKLPWQSHNPLLQWEIEHAFRNNRELKKELIHHAKNINS